MLKKLYAKDKVLFWGLVATFWFALFVAGFLLHWSTLTKVMMLSLTASGIVFAYSAKQDKKWVEKYGSEEELQKIIDAKEAAWEAEQKHLAEQNAKDDKEAQ